MSDLHSIVTMYQEPKKSNLINIPYFKIMENLYSFFGVLSYSTKKTYISVKDILFYFDEDSFWKNDAYLNEIELAQVKDIIPQEKDLFRQNILHDTYLLELELVQVKDIIPWEKDLFRQDIYLVDYQKALEELEEIHENNEFGCPLFKWFEYGHVLESHKQGIIELIPCHEYEGRSFASWLASKYISKRLREEA